MKDVNEPWHFDSRDVVVYLRTNPDCPKARGHGDTNHVPFYRKDGKRPWLR